MNAIEIEGLYKQFKGKKMTRVDALKDLTLSIGQGEVFGFLGPNGAGKSTTIKLLMGLITPTSGSARLMGVDASKTESRSKAGYLPENPAFYDYLTAEEYIRFVGSQFAMDNKLLAVNTEKVLRRLDLWDARKRPMRGYSKGMVQRVGLAQTLVHDPEVYILDEPMSGLDPIGRALVKEIILELKSRGKCVFFSTHITADVEQVCDRVGVILKGELKSVEKVETILTTGISGYQVRTTSESGEISEEVVPTELLSATLNLLAEQGKEVSLVEPVRKDLEQFFLDIVKAG